MTIGSDEPGVLEVAGLTTDAIGERAAAEGLTLHELSTRQASLEDAFMELTRDAVGIGPSHDRRHLPARDRVRVHEAALAAVQPHLAADGPRPRRRPRAFVPWLSVTDWRDGTPTAGYNAVERSLSGIYLAQIAFGVLGAMVDHRRVRDRLDPLDVRRRPAPASRAVEQARRVPRATLVLGTIASVLAFIAGQAIFSTKHVDASFGDPHVARAVLGCGLFLAAMGAFGLALGALLRNTAAAITTLTLVLFVVPVIVDVMPKGERSARTCPPRRG